MRTLIALTLVSLTTAACGYKGALYLPKPTKQEAPASKPVLATQPKADASAPSTKP